MWDLYASKFETNPVCTACQYAKQRRKTTPGTVKKSIKEQAQALKMDDMFSGSCISVDHFEANPKGRLLTSFGKELNDQKYRGGCIFVDHASGYIHVELQTRLNIPETIDAKRFFEETCFAHGVVPQSYITDEGSSFTSEEYLG